MHVQLRKFVMEEWLAEPRPLLQNSLRSMEWKWIWLFMSVRPKIHFACSTFFLTEYCGSGSLHLIHAVSY